MNAPTLQPAHFRVNAREYSGGIRKALFSSGPPRLRSAPTLALPARPRPRPARAQLIDLAPVTQTVKVSPDLLRLVRDSLSGARVKVVVQANGPTGFLLETLLLTLDARTTSSATTS